MDAAAAWIESLKAWDFRLFTLGQSQVTVSTLLGLVIATIALFTVSNWFRRWLAQKLLRRTQLDDGARDAVGMLARYVMLVVGFLVIVQTSGIDLTTFHVLAGAVGVGIGFGLQNIVSNFISGLIVMVERPVKVGDRIQVAVDQPEGDVIEIGARSTKLATAKGFVLIVPNQRLITENVRNWEYRGHTDLVTLALKVAHGQNVRTVEAILLDAARAHRDVLREPAPRVDLLSIDAGGCAVELWVWTHTSVATRQHLVTALNFAVLDALARTGVTLA